jgi:hypothetical protein
MSDPTFFHLTFFKKKTYLLERREYEARPQNDQSLTESQQSKAVDI